MPNLEPLALQACKAGSLTTSWHAAPTVCKPSPGSRKERRPRRRLHELLCTREDGIAMSKLPPLARRRPADGAVATARAPDVPRCRKRRRSVEHANAAAQFVAVGRSETCSFRRLRIPRTERVLASSAREKIFGSMSMCLSFAVDRWSSAQVANGRTCMHVHRNRATLYARCIVEHCRSSDRWITGRPVQPSTNRQAMRSLLDRVHHGGLQAA